MDANKRTYWKNVYRKETRGKTRVDANKQMKTVSKPRFYIGLSYMWSYKFLHVWTQKYLRRLERSLCRTTPA